MNNSKIVTTNQKGIHENLQKVLSRYDLNNYQRPISSYSLDTFKQIKKFVGTDKFILDLGCGVGQSSFELKKVYPNYKIVGIDKSIKRLNKNNDYETVDDILLVRAELLDLIPKLMDLSDQIVVTYILYPNPWPKSIHYKRRFHFNPVMPFICELSEHIVLRSNWKLYLEEFSAAYLFLKQKNSDVKEVQIKREYLTPFEKKYHQSGQKIYELEIK
ncbi:MAG: hypothetical protein N4A33_12055 [Bacteriovoracaceae bacterium]|jgi:tRNA G46 methylase TrmB|nr:hypothetical protein [Bacteriovoracaceae bacterium]